MDTPLALRRVGYLHPDAQALVARVQAEYVERYGSPDESPVDPVVFDPPEGLFVVGYDAGSHGSAGAPVATGAWRRSPVQVLDGTSAVEVKRMFVVPEARGRGFARAVLAELEDTAGAAGHDTVILETGLRQPEAIALYLSAGYVEIPGFGYYRDAPLSRCYGKRLGG
ncbi:GNAT family N-acetyltransferase [Nocardioides caeni]|uniref:GNAT family N-acetyltransferase n=1 Tax=Nocardioides caeni TaxID=574700 RepID=A0A4S8N877_9ACTN|nr:GNAT family N-acetyltransferase [Nocardioides caeni]THV12175.1 GNAT family N-acetyltransferase [Nocardioides caeni]